MLTRSSLTIRLHPNDDVVIARTQLVGGTNLLDEKITVSGLVPPGHKVATRAIKAGEPVRRYNQIIGFASRDIAPGEHVHLNNLAMGSFERDYAYGADAKPTQYVSPAATFMGIVRPDGRVVWLDSRAVLVRDQEGRPKYWQGVAIDVTAHRELETRYRDLAGMVFGELGIEAD